MGVACCFYFYFYYSCYFYHSPPPSPINNRSIVVQRPHGLALRPHTDHFKFSEDIWSMYVYWAGLKHPTNPLNEQERV